MHYFDFEKKLVSEILKDKKKCIDTINDNKDLVIQYLRDTEKPAHITDLVNKFNDMIIEKLKNYKLIEKVLKHELFVKVLEEFRESDVLIKAMKSLKLDAIKWLLTMDMNYFAQDEKGMTALLVACKSTTLLFALKEILKKNEDIVYIADYDGNTALFYAKDKDVFSLLCETKIDFNHVNNEGDTLLINCCRKVTCPLFQEILSRTPEDKINYVNKKGRSALMYLVELGNYRQLELLCKDYKPDINYRNMNNETAVTILMNKFKKMYSINTINSFFHIEDYAYTMNTLVRSGADFNIAIDKEGNTPIMYFIMVGDYFATTYLLEKYRKLDLSIKNVYGISASYLLFWIRPIERDLKELLINHNSFDSDFADNDNNDLIMHILARGDIKYLKSVLAKKKKFNHVNNKKENEIIIATKLGLLCEELLKNNDINQQDELGNTALFYAVKLKDREAINMLVYFKADPLIKNYQGVSALDLAEQLKEECIFDILNNPVTPEQMKKVIEKEGKTFGIFNKKKTTDDKLVDYIKNYQINNYKEEYAYLPKNKKRSYSYVDIDPDSLSKFIRAYQSLYFIDVPHYMNYMNHQNEY